jgi:Fic family protein
MSHIEIKKVKDEEYASFVKKKRIMGRTYRISEHIGKNVPTINKRDYLLRNLDHISDKEFALRKPLIEDLDISYSDKLLFDVELLSIKMDNLLEAKESQETVLVEFAKEFIFNSNNIEGSQIPAEEVKKIIETGNSRYKNANEVKEVFNSINAMEYIRTGFKFNIPSIKRLYYVITKDLLMQNGMPYLRGFKTERNVVNNMETVPPELVVSKLSELLEYYKENNKKEHPLKIALYFHLKYEEIHPFMDGNGRTGRMIMNKILMSNGYFPIIIYSNNSTAYYNAIAKGLTRKNKRAYFQFMLEQARKTYTQFYTIIQGS